MKYRVPLLWAIMLSLLALFATACDRNDSSSCEGISCEDWQSCAAGACVNLPERCASYLDCNTDEICGDDHRCHGPTQPPESFFELLGDNSVSFSYRGLINSYDDLTQGALTDGLGAWQVHTSGSDEVLNESAFSYRRMAPDTYPEASLRGHEIIVFGVSRVLELGSSFAHYHYLSGALAVESLVQIVAEETPEAAAPEEMVLKLWDVTMHQRSWDRASFRRYCLLAERAPVAGEALFLNYFFNETFAPGEDLTLWGNIGLSDRVTITPGNEEQRCSYEIDGVPVSRSEYEAELAHTSPTLPCDTPDGLLDAVATESATFVFLGPINDLSDGFANFDMGLGALQITADSTELVADDSYLLAYRYSSPPTYDLIVLQTLGSVAQPAQDRYQYLLFRLMVDRPTLLDMVTGGAASLAYDPAYMTASLEWVDDKVRGTDSWFKVCPQLISAPAGGSGAIAACYDPSTEFVAGEHLELAGSLPMTSDATAIATMYSTNEPCFCYLNLSTNPVTCAEFDAQ